MDWPSIITSLLSAATGVLSGGGYMVWRNRKQSERIAEAEADGRELDTMKETHEFLQQAYAESVKHERELNAEVLQLTNEKAAAELRHAKEMNDKDMELMSVRCNDSSCPMRQPPNINTPKGKDHLEWLNERERSRQQQM